MKQYTRFGYDVFIAYSRDDTHDYAHNLYERLNAEPYRLKCFIDTFGFKPGTWFRDRTLRALLMTHMLIVVFTKGALDSEHVQREVRLFLWLRKWFFWNRPVSILDLNGDWQQVLDDQGHDEQIKEPWRQLRLEDLDGRLHEKEVVRMSKGPSPDICQRYGTWKSIEQLKTRDFIVVVGSMMAAATATIAALGFGWFATKLEREITTLKTVRGQLQHDIASLTADARFVQAEAMFLGGDKLAAQILLADSLQHDDRSQTRQRLLEISESPALEMVGRWPDQGGITVSQNGRIAAAVSGYDTVWIWNISERCLVAKLGYNSEEGDVFFGSVALNADGSRVAVGEYHSRKVWIWDTQSGTLLRQLDGTSRVYAFGPEDSLFCGSRSSPQGTLWDTSTGNVIRNFQCPVVDGKNANSIADARFSSDGRYLALALHLDVGSAVCVWEWQLESQSPIVAHDSHLLHRIAFHPNGESIVTGSRTNSDKSFVRHLRFRDERGQSLTDILVPVEIIGTVTGLHVDDTGVCKALVFNCPTVGTGTVELWNVFERRKVTTLGRRKDEVEPTNRELFSPDGSRVFSGRDDGTLRVWKILEPALHNAFYYDARHVTAIAVHPRERRLAAALEDGTISVRRFLEPRNEELVLRNSGSKDQFVALAYQTPDCLVSVDDEGTIARWDVKMERRIEPTLRFCDDNVKARQMPVRAVGASPDGSIVATGSKRISQWCFCGVTEEMRGESLLIPALESGVQTVGNQGDDASEWLGAISFSADSKFLAAGFGRDEICVLKRDAAHIGPYTNYRKVNTELGPHKDVFSLAFSRDSKWLAAGTGYGLLVFDCFDSFRRIDVCSNEVVSAVAFSADGKWLATTENGKVALRRSNSWEVACVIRISDVYLKGAMFSADGKMLIAIGSGERCGSVHFWDLDKYLEFDKLHTSGSAIQLEQEYRRRTGRKLVNGVVCDLEFKEVPSNQRFKE